MGASGFDPDLYQREFAIAPVDALRDLPVAHSASSRATPRRHAGPPDGVAADRIFDRAGFARHLTVDQRPVDLMHLAAGKLLGQPAVRKIVLGRQNEPAGIAVKAVHDAGTQGSTGAGQLAEAMQQRVDQCAPVAGVIRRARARMNHHAGRLVDDRQIVVLVDHVERNLFGERTQRLRIERPEKGYVLVAAQTQRRLGRAVCDQYLPVGDHGRSGEQFDIWQAVYGPVGPDGYPQPIFDKVTGDIDHTVAEYWHQNFDLESILERNWTKLGPELAGKIHIYVGSDDTYFLNDAVYRMEDFLNSTKNPPYGGEVTYGPRAEHCWNGDPTQPNAHSRLHYNTMYMPKILEQIQKTAPKGADLTSWRY